MTARTHAHVRQVRDNSGVLHSTDGPTGQDLHIHIVDRQGSKVLKWHGWQWETMSHRESLEGKQPMAVEFGTRCKGPEPVIT
ncbi:jg23435 [Pararge aegeria aegeria]|uniref:Jg23435 protein n=1 Tax=Pararge aegeria aegeria TaxID=348720 RepID=A0A8S4RYV3_9NEOP|nr:jg23435 [Pararge aegeria aegeria]